MNKHIVAQVAQHMWNADGRPERDAEPTSVGYNYYETISNDVLQGLLDLGYKIVKPRGC